MYKIVLAVVTVFSSFFAMGNPPNVSTTSVVCLVGASIKAQETPIVTKYKRKDCPVCKGTGKYRSGDGIEEVDCGYCEE